MQSSDFFFKFNLASNQENGKCVLAAAPLFIELECQHNIGW